MGWFGGGERLDRMQGLAAATREILVDPHPVALPRQGLCSSSGPTTRAGAPSAFDPGGITVPAVTTAPAPTSASAPISAPSSTVAPMPMSANDPMRQPCSTAPCPDMTVRLQHGVRTGEGVDHARVLHVRPLADDDAPE